MLEKLKSGSFWPKNRTQFIKAAVLLILVIIAFAIYFSGGKDEEGIAAEEEEAGSVETVEEAEPAASSEVTVDITGAVAESRVVTLPQGARVADAIEECGGAAENADLTAINRAALLVDGEQIRIPTREETAQGTGPQPGGGTAATADPNAFLININTATEEELQALNGVGPATAEKIVAYRESYGRFTRIEDLKEVNGIGDKTFEKLKDHITV